MRFLNAYTHFGFTKIFGSAQSKDVLLSFLNALIMLDDNSKITDLEVVDSNQAPGLKATADTSLDIKIVLSNGNRAIVKIQLIYLWRKEICELQHAAKTWSMPLNAGQPSTSPESVIALTITDFTMFADLDKVVSYFHLLEKEALIEYSGDIELIFIELPKFLKTEQELTDITDKWIFFLKNAGSLEYIPESLAKEPSIQHAFAIANTAGLSRDELDMHIKRTAYIRDIRAVYKRAAAS